MYYMDHQIASNLKWSRKGLMALLRDTVPDSVDSGEQDDFETTRLSIDHFDDLAHKWRERSRSGDETAAALALAFKSVADRRRTAQAKKSRMEVLRLQLAAWRNA